jgi:hypothetical protein
MTIEERICGEDGAQMRDAGIQPDGSRTFVCTINPGHVLSLLVHGILSHRKLEALE